MVYVYNCCFYFSLRLGAIIIGIICLTQGVAKIILSSMGLNDPLQISSDIKYLLKHYNLIGLEYFMECVQKDTEQYLTAVLILSVIYSTSCVIMMYGAYKCLHWFLYPFIILEIIRFFLMFSAHVILMMLIKENVVNLGLLIGLTILGGFLLLGVFYCWFCVLNLSLLINQLKREIKKSEEQNVSQEDIAMKNGMQYNNQRLIYSLNSPYY